MMSDLLSSHLASIVLPYKPVDRFTSSPSIPLSSACIVDYKAKALDDAKVYKWSSA